MNRTHLLAPLLLVGLCSTPVPASASTPSPAPGSSKGGATRVKAPPLRVCSDPNNLPFSNRREEGFENRLAEWVARQLGRRLVYVWKPQRRGFLRTGLNAGECELVMGLPAQVDMALTTIPYYRSSYVFVHKRGLAPLESLDDPRLSGWKVGVQLIGDDYSNAPPAHALARRGLARNLVGYTVYGDYAQDSPALEIVRGVERGEVDVSIAWGPFAGYLAKRSKVPLVVTPVRASAADVGLPMRFDVSMAVSKKNPELKAKLDRLIERRRRNIDAILRDFGVPRV